MLKATVKWPWTVLCSKPKVFYKKDRDSRHKLQIKDSGITDGDDDQNVTIRSLEE